MSNQVIITPKDQYYYVGFEPKEDVDSIDGPTPASNPQATKVQSLRDAFLVKAFYNHLKTSYQFKDVFIITGLQSYNSQSTFVVTTLIEGKKKFIRVDLSDIQKELNLASSDHLSFQSTSTNPKTPEEQRTAIKDGSFKDGFTLAAASYFQIKKPKVSEIPTEWNAFTPQERLAIQGEKVVLTRRGLSRFERVFHRYFNTNAYQKYMDQNSKTIQTYQNFLVREVGKEKIACIEKTFGLSLDKMKEEGYPLLPIHVYYFNVGMNDIVMDDVERFAKKFKQISPEFTKNNTASALDFLQNSDKSPFTMREARGMLAFTDNPESVTLGDLANRFTSPYFFNRCIEAVTTSRKDWEGVYTGCKFDAPICGSYNQEVDDLHTIRPNIDMQELAQIHHEILDTPNEDPQQASRIFKEYLTKVAVKKHLMRSSADGTTWKVGSLIPSPFKDENGERIWYRVDQGVDSGHGKLWYVFKPADNNYDQTLPVYRVPRDTCPSRYAQRGGPTISRDLAKNAGYKYSSATEREDQAFFDQFTLPVWMGHLLIAYKSQDVQSQTNALIKAKDELLIENGRRLLSEGLSPEAEEKIRRFNVYTEKAFQNPENNINDLYQGLLRAATEKDRILFDNLLVGRKPRPLISAGNSLGGFDAQYDIVKHTALRNRVPVVDLSLYTHSTLKIKQTDDETFTNFIEENQPILDTLNVSLHFDHITEEGDIVSMFGNDRTFLGCQLNPKALRVFRPLKQSNKPEVQQLSTHCRRVESAKPGEDIEWANYTVSEYKDYSARKRIAYLSLDGWHKLAQSLGLFTLTDTAWRGYRYFHTGGRIPHENRNHKLTVKYEDGHVFEPIPKKHLSMESRPFIRPHANYIYETLGLQIPPSPSTASTH